MPPAVHSNTLHVNLPGPKVVSLGFDNQATISTIARPGYSYLAIILRDLQKATTSLLRSGSTVHVGLTSGHPGIASNDSADAAAKLAVPL